MKSHIVRDVSSFYHGSLKSPPSFLQENCDLKILNFIRNMESFSRKKNEEKRIPIRLSCFIRTEKEIHFQGLAYPFDKEAWEEGIHKHSLLELAESLEIRYGGKPKAKAMKLEYPNHEIWLDYYQNRITLFLWTLNWISGTITEHGSKVIDHEQLNSTIASLDLFSFLSNHKLGSTEIFEIVVVDGTFAGPKESEIFKNIFRTALNV